MGSQQDNAFVSKETKLHLMWKVFFLSKKPDGDRCLLIIKTKLITNKFQIKTQFLHSRLICGLCVIKFPRLAMKVRCLVIH